MNYCIGHIVNVDIENVTQAYPHKNRVRYTSLFTGVTSLPSGHRSDRPGFSAGVAALKKSPS